MGFIYGHVKARLGVSGILQMAAINDIPLYHFLGFVPPVPLRAAPLRGTTLSVT